jgi:hypothetical protein
VEDGLVTIFTELFLGLWEYLRVNMFWDIMEKDLCVKP